MPPYQGDLLSHVALSHVLSIAQPQLVIGTGNWQHLHTGNTYMPPLFVTPAQQAFSRSPKGLFASAERSYPKGGGHAARGKRPAVQADAPRCPAIAARRSTATAAFVVARKRTIWKSKTLHTPGRAGEALARDAKRGAYRFFKPQRTHREYVRW